MDDNTFEKMPGASAENNARADEFEETMSNAPDFAGNQSEEAGETFDEDIAGAASLITYGVNAATSEMGLDYVINTIERFDASSSENPLKDFYKSMGINTKEEREEMRDERKGVKSKEQGYFASSPNGKPIKKPSKEGMVQAVKDLKELIRETQIDPKYKELRDGASAMGVSIFKYAVKDYGKQDYVTLMKVLAEQRIKEKPNENEKLKDNIFLKINEINPALEESADDISTEGKSQKEILNDIENILSENDTEKEEPKNKDTITSDFDKNGDANPSKEEELERLKKEINDIFESKEVNGE